MSPSKSSPRAVDALLVLIVVGLLGYMVHGAMVVKQQPVRARGPELADPPSVSTFPTDPSLVRATLSDEARARLDPMIGPVHVPGTLAADYEVLVSATFFAPDVVGYVAAVPEESRTWVRIANSPNAKEIFAQVLVRGTIEAQMYALCGLAGLDSKLGEELRRGLDCGNTRVLLFEGCLRRTVPAQAFLAGLDLREASSTIAFVNFVYPPPSQGGATLSDEAVARIGQVDVPPALVADYEMLSSANEFATVRVGRGGAVPEGLSACMRIADSPNARQVFERVLVEGTIEGQMYALCGLAEIDAELAEAYRRQLDCGNLEVRVMRYCIGDLSRARTLVASLDLAEAVREMRAVIADEELRSAAPRRK